MTFIVELWSFCTDGDSYPHLKTEIVGASQHIEGAAEIIRSVSKKRNIKPYFCPMPPKKDDTEENIEQWQDFRDFIMKEALSLPEEFDEKFDTETLFWIEFSVFQLKYLSSCDKDAWAHRFEAHLFNVREFDFDTEIERQYLISYLVPELLNNIPTTWDETKATILEGGAPNGWEELIAKTKKKRG